MSSPKHVLIIGAGIAGTALALFLRKAGIRATIFEAYPSLKGPAGGFCIAPNGMKVIGELGLADAVVGVGAPMREFCFRSDRGDLLGRISNGRPEEGRVPAISLGRGTLHQILIDSVKRERIEVHCAKRLKAIKEKGSKRIVAQFEDGTEQEGDVLIGADGVWSRTRQLIDPKALPPEYLGVLGVGGFLTRPNEGPCADDETMHFSVGNGAQFGFGRFDSTADKWGWWCHLPHPLLKTAEDKQALTTEALRKRLLDRYDGWHAPITDMIRDTPEFLVTAIHTVRPLPRWSKGCVALIGDAAHAMSPSSGQGASQALEDALVLAKLLRDQWGDLPSVFQAYEAERRPRAEAIAKTGVANEVRQNKAMSPFGCWLRNRIMAAVLPRFGAGMFEHVYRYELTWE